MSLSVDQSPGVVARLVWLLLGAALGALMLYRLRHPLAETLADAGPGADAHLAMGQMLYDRSCYVCHGISGAGNGPASAGLDPHPRNFRLGNYRLISSDNSKPFKQDIVHTIRNGMAGTSMPAWSDYTDEQVDALADYVLSITRAERGLMLLHAKVKPKVVPKLVVTLTAPGQKVAIPPEPPVSPDALERARAMFLVTCAPCHEADGRGRQDPTWRTDDDFTIASRNFTSHVFKGGGRGADLYTRIYAGMPGTPMPGFSSVAPDDIWGLVHYVQLLADPNALAKASLPGDKGGP